MNNLSASRRDEGDDSDDEAAGWSDYETDAAGASAAGDEGQVDRARLQTFAPALSILTPHPSVSEQALRRSLAAEDELRGLAEEVMLVSPAPASSAAATVVDVDDAVDAATRRFMIRRHRGDRQRRRRDLIELLFAGPDRELADLHALQDATRVHHEALRAAAAREEDARDQMALAEALRRRRRTVQQGDEESFAQMQEGALAAAALDRVQQVVEVVEDMIYDAQSRGAMARGGGGGGEQQNLLTQHARQSFLPNGCRPPPPSQPHQQQQQQQQQQRHDSAARHDVAGGATPFDTSIFSGSGGLDDFFKNMSGGSNPADGGAGGSLGMSASPGPEMTMASGGGMVASGGGLASAGVDDRRMVYTLTIPPRSQHLAKEITAILTGAGLAAVPLSPKASAQWLAYHDVTGGTIGLDAAAAEEAGSAAQTGGKTSSTRSPGLGTSSLLQTSVMIMAGQPSTASAKAGPKIEFQLPADRVAKMRAMAVVTEYRLHCHRYIERGDRVTQSKVAQLVEQGGYTHFDAVMAVMKRRGANADRPSSGGLYVVKKTPCQSRGFHFSRL